MKKDLGLKQFAGMVNTATKVDTRQSDAPREIEIDKIDAKPQIRRRFAAEPLAELAVSIKSIGIIQPIVLQPKPDGRFEIIAGERRYRAAKIAGLKSVPVLIRSELSPLEQREMMIAENQQREEIDAYDEALAVKEDVSVFGADEAQRIWNRSKSWVSKRVAATDYHPEVTALLSTATCTDFEVLHCLNAILPSDRSSFEQLVHRITEGAAITRIREDARTKVQDLKQRRKDEAERNKRTETIGRNEVSDTDVPLPLAGAVEPKSSGTVDLGEGVADGARAEPVTRPKQKELTAAEGSSAPPSRPAGPAQELEQQLTDLGRLVAACLTSAQQGNADLYKSFKLVADPILQSIGQGTAREFFERVAKEASNTDN